MPIRNLQGLQGLSGLNKAQYDNFINKNKDLIAQHGYDPTYINNLYSNKQFIDKYGIDKFKAIPDIDMRNTLYKTDVVNTEFNKAFGNVKGFDYNKYNQLSTDGKLKLLESNYLTPSEFENSWQKRMKESAIEKSGTGNSPSKTMAMGAGVSLMRSISSLTNAISKGRGLSEAMGLFTPGGEEAAKKIELDKNQRILDNIYNEDADSTASKFSSEVQQAYDEYATMGDNAVYKAFMKAITPESYRDRNGIPNLGIAEYKKYFGNGSENERKGPMLDFSIDDMRQVLAKKKVYDANMSPMMAAQALNNDAKRYATEHQNAFRKFGLFMKDVGISSLSYTADKVNGIYDLGLLAADKLGDKPIVYVDDKGDVIDPKKTKIIKNVSGNLVYRGEDGKVHYVHRQQIDRTTLHNMGKNFDGSEDNSILNPQYWTRAEQFGTLDENEQKQYERLGTSPYKVAYNPNDDSDLLYESFKMMSFGIADGMSQLLPYGIGLFGKTLSAASKAGKIAQGLGKVLDTSGKLLTAETKVGQVAQGTAGALGIAYAYNRGAFQETLVQNLANAEEALVNTAKNDIYNRYQTDKQYKTGVDRLINAKAAGMKADYLAQIRRDGGMKVADMKAIDKMIYAKAQDAVLGELVQNNINERKSSKEYANLQQKAIDGAGDAALNTFLTEGLKYGFVNNLGYRKFLYTNPAGLSKKVSSSLKGLKEITTSEGRKRMTTEASKFLTRGDKLKEFGKTLGSQAWGGAWTNGTDDMQVDAAERINEDSFNRYLKAYQSGKALASTYGFADNLYSYVKGLQNSMGQETTLNAATVGGLGSILNFTPNMANIARLTTREGREAYKNNFWREQVRDKENYNKPILNEDGTPKYENKGRMHDWRGQINYLIQNGVLNTYYGKKQSERDLQNHADFVNNLLDEYKDFEDIEHLVASNMAAENYSNIGDLKTANYLKALNAINTLNNLANDSKDPTTMSSVVQNAKNLIDKAAQLNNVVEGKENPFSEEEVSDILSQYYAANPGTEQNEANNQKALYTIAENAQKLQEASKAFEEAGKEISKIESNSGTTIDSDVKLQLMLQKALVDHWRERKEKMQSEIGDTSSDNASMDANTYIASVGGRKNAQTLVKTYNRQQKEIEGEIEAQKKKTAKLQEELDKATKEYNNAYNSGEWFTTDNNTLKLEKKVNDVKAKVSNSKMQEDFLEGMLTRTVEKRKSLEMDMSNMSIDETNRRVALAQEELSKYQDKLNSLKEERKKYINKNGERNKSYSLEKIAEIDKSIKDYEYKVASRKETLERNKEKVLTADEIFSLDPVTRARMMDKANRELYTKEQQREIENLEQKLAIKDADALQKIQDIALLTQRINTNEDAYNRIASNPLAASKAFEEQRLNASLEASGIFDQRNAENLANIIKIQEVAFKLYDTADEGFMEDYAYMLLRQHNSKLLDIIDEDNLLPQYKLQLDKAKEWQKVTEDIDSVIYNSDKSEKWKKNLNNNISGILDNIDNKDSIIPTLEKIVDDTDGQDASKDIDYVLEGLKSLGYQRDATILEKRQERKEKEEAERKKREEEQKKAEEEAKAAAEKKVEESNKTPKKDKTVEQVPTNENFNEDSALDLSDGEKSKEEASKPQTIDEEDLQQTPENTVDGKLLMSDNYGNGSIGFGDMYYGEGKKGNFTATRDGDKIIFNTADNKETLNIAPNEYDVVTDEQETKKNLPFIANSIEKKDGDWYFIGNFAGDKQSSEVKANKNFDIDKAIERQQAVREEEFAAKSNTVDNKNLIDNGDTIEAKSPTIEEQMEDIPSDVEVHTSDNNIDVAEENVRGEKEIEDNVVTLGGNAMSRYEPRDLENNGKLVLKKGSKSNDNMNKYYAWMDAAGIKLQNIIDHELARIIQKNPHAKVKFMIVNRAGTATHDDYMENHLMLVLDYDNKINKGITSIHDDANGGVIDFNGKRYLVIGTAGYPSNNNSKRDMWYRIWNKNTKLHGDLGLIIPNRAKYLKEHPNDRFYVAEDYTTEIVPYSQIPGYIVRQGLNDAESKHRKLSELLSDKERNPTSYTLDNVPMGIQELSQFLITGTSLSNVMVPRNVSGNAGSAFVLMPASNGKFVPSYLKPLMYTEMNNGTLKDRIDVLLQDIVSPNYNNRKEALKGLLGIFYFGKNGDNILIGKEGIGTVSLVHGDQILKTFVLDSNFDRGEFMKAFEELNPRINITARVLTNKKLLREYDEAGALTTDAAIFGTAGSSYSIYGLDPDGKIMFPASPANNIPSADNSDYKRPNRQQVVFKKQFYNYDIDNGKYYLGSKEITDEKEIKQLDYNRMVVDADLTLATSKGVWDYFIVETGDNPKVIKIDKNTKEVKELSKEDSQKLIEKIAKEEAKKQREADAQKDLEDVDMNNIGLTVDQETGETIGDTFVENTEENNQEKTSKEEVIDKEVPITNTDNKNVSTEETKDNKDTQTFTDLFKSKSYMRRLNTLIRSKWKDAPSKPTDLEKFLKGKNIEVDNIGTSKEDIESWIKTIEDCR